MNLFDARFFNGAVFQSTGSPYYSRFPESDKVALADPTRFYPPRRIEFGLRLGNLKIAPAMGDTHLEQILRELALYGIEG